MTSGQLDESCILHEFLLVFLGLCGVWGTGIAVETGISASEWLLPCLLVTVSSYPVKYDRYRLATVDTQSANNQSYLITCSQLPVFSHCSHSLGLQALNLCPASYKVLKKHKLYRQGGKPWKFEIVPISAVWISIIRKQLFIVFICVTVHCFSRLFKGWKSLQDSAALKRQFVCLVWQECTELQCNSIAGLHLSTVWELKDSSER